MLLSYQDDEERKLIQKILEKKKVAPEGLRGRRHQKGNDKTRTKKNITRDKIGQSPEIDMIREVATYFQIRKWLSFCSIACYNRSG